MYAVILAAGKGTRMGELTRSTPKPMLGYRGKNLIEHKLDALPSQIRHIILVIGYQGHVIRDYFGDSYKGLPITYVEQSEALGTGHSLWQARKHIDDKFLVLMGDDLYDKAELEKLTEHNHAVLAYRLDRQRAGGKFFLNPDGTIKTIIEDFDGSMDSPFIYTGVCVLTPIIFSYPLVQIPNKKEYGLPQTLVQMTDKHPIHIVVADFWKQITVPEDLNS